MAIESNGSSFETPLKKLKGAKLTVLPSAVNVVIQAIGLGMMLPLKNLYCCFYDSLSLVK